jgi:hypothetical protein
MIRRKQPRSQLDGMQIQIVTCFALALLLLSGCQSPTQNENPSGRNQQIATDQTCPYSSLQTPTFRLTTKPDELAMNIQAVPRFAFLADPLDVTRYAGKVIRFTGRSFEGAAGSRRQESFTSAGSNYECQGGMYEFITEDCLVGYIDSMHVRYSAEGIPVVLRFDGARINHEDLKPIMPCREQAMIAAVEADEFTGKTWIRTPATHRFGLMLRALVNTKTHRLHFIQVYAQTSSKYEWSFYDRAYAKGGQRLELTRASSYADCVGSSCYANEAIAITIPVNFLMANRNGFEVKAIGSGGSVVLKVESPQIEALIDALGKADVRF